MVKIPIKLREQIDFCHRVCGYVGLEDYTLYSLIRPGSFVGNRRRQNETGSLAERI